VRRKSANLKLTENDVQQLLNEVQPTPGTSLPRIETPVATEEPQPS
jgi:hypothetical protein